MSDCPQQKWTAAKLNRGVQKPEFAALVRPWVMRARLGTEPFERLIHLWVAFNAWAAETIVPPNLMERDAALVAAATRDPALNARFRDLLDQDPDFNRFAAEFRSFWPVFNVRRVDQLGISGWMPEFQSRGEYRRVCFDAGASEHHFKPDCFLTHQNGTDVPVGGDPDLVPLDWPHTLAVIYQVRCNLFHGGKSFRTQSDVRFVELAFEILWHCWGAEIIEAFSS